MSLDAKLATLTNVSQKDKGVAYSDLLKQLISAPQPSADDIGKLVNNAVSQDHVGLVVARQVLGDLVNAIDGEPFKSNQELTKKVIENALESVQRSVSYQEQVNEWCIC